MHEDNVVTVEENVGIVLDPSPTFGEKAVGLSFNPGGDPDVTELKELYAAIIDKLNNMRGAERGERSRLLSVAITEAQGAQMWAVKGATWKD